MAHKPFRPRTLSVYCEFANPCQCGVESLSQAGVVCNQCEACGNGTCDANETPENCPIDCGATCTPGAEQCSGSQRLVWLPETSRKDLSQLAKVCKGGAELLERPTAVRVVAL